MKTKHYFQDHNKLICPISGDKDFKKIFSLNRFPIYMGTVEKDFKTEKKNMNFQINKKTGSVQIFPRVNLSKLYFKSHGSGKIGKTWKNHHEKFYEFIKIKSNIDILEIGGGHNSISLKSKKKKIQITSFEPNIKKKAFQKNIINEFFSSSSLSKYNLYEKFDIAVHSHLFEHIYDPESFLLTINKSLRKNGLHIFTVPNMDAMIKQNIASAMNFEHPFFLNENMIKILLAKTGFKILKKNYFGKYHSIFYRTVKTEKKQQLKIKNNYKKNFKLFKSLSVNWKNDVKKLNSLITKRNNIFLFGAHIFSQMLIFNGLNYKNIHGILDNDNNKISNYLYGTNFKIFSPKYLKKFNMPMVILRAGAYNEEIKRDILTNINSKTKFI